MTAIPSAFQATADYSALKLPRYAQIIRYDENAFFGINAPTNRERACHNIWTKLERDMVARCIGEAQDMIESVLGYPIGQKWYENEQHRNSRRFFTKWSYVQALGNRAVSAIASGVALNHTTDPATLPSTPTTVTNSDEIHFYQPGTTIEVYPDTLTLSGGNVSATFPRARLVLEAFQDNPDTGLPYSDTGPSGPFAQALDIKRVYTDTSDVGEFVWPLTQDCDECDEDTQPACGYIRSNQYGIVTLLNSETSDCIWRGASEIRINYCAGKPIDRVAEDAIIHLAHALAPMEPCQSCDPLRVLWNQDREIPAQITAERANGMFGVHEGAWRAWVYATRNKHVRMPLL